VPLLLGLYSNFFSALLPGEKVVEECLSRYQPSEVCVSFNGGKDCSALLHIIYVVWKKLQPHPDCRLQAMYIRGSDPFPEMEQFIDETRKRHTPSLSLPAALFRPLISVLFIRRNLADSLMRAVDYPANMKIGHARSIHAGPSVISFNMPVKSPIHY